MNMRGIGLALVLAGLTAAAPAHAQQVQDVTMAVPAFSLTFMEGYVADDLGLWQKHGVNVKSVMIAGVGSMNAVLSGSADVAQVSSITLTRAAARGQHTVEIAQLLDRLVVELVLRKDLAEEAHFDAKAPLEKRVQVLKGRTIAVESINSIIHAYVRLLAHIGGFDPELIKIAVMQPPNMVAAFETKQIDGFAMTPPWPEVVLTEGSAVLVASGPDGDPPNLPLVNSVLLTRHEVCEKRKSVCEKIGHAYAQAAEVIRDHPDQAIGVLKKRFPKLDAKTVDAAFAVLQKITPVPPAATLDGIRNNETFNVMAGLLKPEEQLKSFDGLFTDQYVR
jgi:ABC-type nitrate/sulfonate/bicarbonate transport system substrate-binding protein